MTELQPIKTRLSLLSLGEDETYVDLGAYNGDTVDEFLHYTNGKYKFITALEPNAKTTVNYRCIARK